MFNAIRYTKTLEAARFSREQAEATIDVFLKFMEHNFLTKEDVSALRTETQKEFHNLRFEIRKEFQEVRSSISSTEASAQSLATSLRTEINELRIEFRHALVTLEQKMTIRLGLMQAASVGIFAALIKFF